MSKAELLEQYRAKCLELRAAREAHQAQRDAAIQRCTEALDAIEADCWPVEEALLADLKTLESKMLEVGDVS